MRCLLYMKSIKIIIAFVVIMVAVFFYSVCFCDTLFTGEDGVKYHFSGKGLHTLTIYLDNSDGSNPIITDDGNGNITASLSSTAVFISVRTSSPVLCNLSKPPKITS